MAATNAKSSPAYPLTNTMPTETMPTETHPTPTTEEFHALDPAARRHAIARDVLGSIEAARVMPVRGRYFRTVLEGAIPPETMEGQEFRDVLEDNRAVCQVCALGACFLSAVRLGDRLTLDACVIADCHDLVEDRRRPSRSWGERSQFSFERGDDAFDRQLSRFFSEEQLAVIESAFEISAWWVSHPECDRAVRFGYQHPDNADRLAAIMGMILADPEGEFHP